MRRPQALSAVVRRARGFTLFEVLVAVALFAVVAALAYGGLDSVLRARGQLAEQAEQMARLQLAIGLLERDIRAAAGRPVRDGFGATVPALVGGVSSLELSRHGHANLLEAPRAEVERLAWRRESDQLLRERWPVLDRVPATPIERSSLLQGVQSIRFRFLLRGGRSFDAWPPAVAAPALPAAIEIEFEVEGLGRLRRLVELPDPERSL
ncbi:MAG: type II secretion system minor pseudopilin GspJ [Aquimonas sp.]|nr:type II secretion system minor pseudopilin GspJ [Aquimonas sp.]